MHSLYVDGTSLVMSSNIAMSTAATPAVGCFTVTAGGATIAVSSVTIASTYIVLTLASPVTYGQTVTLTIDRDGTNYPRANTDGGKLAVPVVAASVTNYTDAAAAATLPNNGAPCAPRIWQQLSSWATSAPITLATPLRHSDLSKATCTPSGKAD
jgi:hypothetical protein